MASLANAKFWLYPSITMLNRHLSSFNAEHRCRTIWNGFKTMRGSCQHSVAYQSRRTLNFQRELMHNRPMSSTSRKGFHPHISASTVLDDIICTHHALFSTHHSNVKKIALGKSDSETSSAKYEIREYLPSELVHANSEKGLQDCIEGLKLFKDFLSIEDEESLLNEVTPYLRRLRYEFDHWDNAIHGFRETERSKWNQKNSEIMQRVNKEAFGEDEMTLPLIHVLDISEEGYIKPHIDSERYCGSTIAGLSLGSDSVMRLVYNPQWQGSEEQPTEPTSEPPTALTSEPRTTATSEPRTTATSEPPTALTSEPPTTRASEPPTAQATEPHTALTNEPHTGPTIEPPTAPPGLHVVDVLLPRRSLYVQTGIVRYAYTHEILADAESVFRARRVKRGRRVSIISRNAPLAKHGER